MRGCMTHLTAATLAMNRRQETATRSSRRVGRQLGRRIKAGAVKGARRMVRTMARMQRSVMVSEYGGGVCGLRYRVGDGV